MKVAMLNDFVDYAGAEVSIKQRLSKKPDSIDVDFFTPSDIASIEYDKYDGFVLENIVMFPSESLLPIVSSKPFIKVEHDFNYCTYRNQIQCKTCDLVCPVTAVPIIRQIYENAKLVIAASPIHMKFQKSQLAGWNINYTYGLPFAYSKADIPAISVERKPKSIAYLGTMRAFKGIYDIIELASRRPQYHFDLAGRHGQIKGSLPSNVTYVGGVDDKWSYLAQHEYFIHVPKYPDPCPGTIIEAILMGCKIISNDFVGTLTYPFTSRDEWITALQTSGPLFWDRVATYIKG